MLRRTSAHRPVATMRERKTKSEETAFFNLASPRNTKSSGNGKVQDRNTSKNKGKSSSCGSSGPSSDSCMSVAGPVPSGPTTDSFEWGSSASDSAWFDPISWRAAASHELVLELWACCMQMCMQTWSRVSPSVPCTPSAAVALVHRTLVDSSPGGVVPRTFPAAPSLPHDFFERHFALDTVAFARAISDAEQVTRSQKRRFTSRLYRTFSDAGLRAVQNMHRFSFLPPPQEVPST